MCKKDTSSVIVTCELSNCGLNTITVRILENQKAFNNKNNTSLHSIVMCEVTNDRSHTIILKMVVGRNSGKCKKLLKWSNFDV